MAEWITEAYERARRRYPAVRLPFECFQERLAAVCESAEAAARIHCEDLFLALACARADRVAWEHFADEYLPLLNRYAAQALGRSGEGEDLAQEIVAKLMADGERMAAYSGRGSLAGWLRVAVAHAAVDRFRRGKKQVSLDALEKDGNLPVPEAAADGREDEMPDARWGPILSRVAGECLRKLQPRDRLLLSLYYLHGTPLKDIGRQFGIHEATASRRLDRMRRGLRKQVEQVLRKQHGLRPREVKSLWRWVSPAPLARSLAQTAQDEKNSNWPASRRHE